MLYFYPKDETQDVQDKPVILEIIAILKKYGCEIIGISSDNKKSHEKFIQKYDLPFRLLTDHKSKLRKAKLAQRFIWFGTWKSYIFTK